MNLFDGNGVFNWPAAKVAETLYAPCDWKFFIKPLGKEINLQERLDCWRGAYQDQNLKWPTILELFQQMNRVRARLIADAALANILNGPNFSVVLPQFSGSYKELERLSLAALSRSVGQFDQFDQIEIRILDRHLTSSYIAESRIGELMKRLLTRPISGIFFPDALRGGSVEADRQAIKQLPDDFMLGDIIINILFVIAYKVHLCHSADSPITECSANDPLSVFNFDDDEVLRLVQYAAGRNLDQPYSCSTAGLFVMANAE